MSFPTPSFEFLVFVGAHSVEFPCEVADYGYQVFDELFSQGLVFLVEDNYLSPVLLEKEFEGFKPETCEPVGTCGDDF